MKAAGAPTEKRAGKWMKNPDEKKERERDVDTGHSLVPTSQDQIGFIGNKLNILIKINLCGWSACNRCNFT